MTRLFLLLLLLAPLTAEAQDTEQQGIELTAATDEALIPEGRSYIEGTIMAIEWKEQQRLPVNCEEQSGQNCTESPAHTVRQYPARYTATLANTRVYGRVYKFPKKFKSGKMVVFINHPADDGTLTKGMRIRIYDYISWGDLTGYWSSHNPTLELVWK